MKTLSANVQICKHSGIDRECFIQPIQQDHGDPCTSWNTVVTPTKQAIEAITPLIHGTLRAAPAKVTLLVQDGKTRLVEVNRCLGGLEAILNCADIILDRVDVLPNLQLQAQLNGDEERPRTLTTLAFNQLRKDEHSRIYNTGVSHPTRYALTAHPSSPLDITDNEILAVFVAPKYRTWLSSISCGGYSRLG